MTTINDNEFVFTKYGPNISKYLINYKLTVPSEYDIDLIIKDKKTVKNILTPLQAIAANKASKNHKMKPREYKRDKTKKKEAKEKTEIHQASLLKKEKYVNCFLNN